ncbi:membrane protein [Staphylococcus phage SAC]|nr:membrane protein [Staphylococcus phage SAC]
MIKFKYKGKKYRSTQKTDAIVTIENTKKNLKKF